MYFGKLFKEANEPIELKLDSGKGDECLSTLFELNFQVILFEGVAGKADLKQVENFCGLETDPLLDSQSSILGSIVMLSIANPLTLGSLSKIFFF